MRVPLRLSNNVIFLIIYIVYSPILQLNCFVITIDQREPRYIYLLCNIFLKKHIFYTQLLRFIPRNAKFTLPLIMRYKIRCLNAENYHSLFCHICTLFVCHFVSLSRNYIYFPYFNYKPYNYNWIKMWKKSHIHVLYCISVAQ